VVTSNDDNVALAFVASKSNLYIGLLVEFADKVAAETAGLGELITTVVATFKGASVPEIVLAVNPFDDVVVIIEPVVQVPSAS
jgi:hypothetical protein